jgi:hypothetical protein
VLEPFAPALHDAGVCAAVHEVGSRIEVFPDREVDDDPIILIWTFAVASPISGSVNGARMRAMFDLRQLVSRP